MCAIIISRPSHDSTRGRNLLTVLQSCGESLATAVSAFTVVYAGHSLGRPVSDPLTEEFAFIKCHRREGAPLKYYSKVRLGNLAASSIYILRFSQ